MKLADFEGHWKIERRIEDRLARHEGWLTGQAVFVPQGQALIYTETGELQFPGQTEIATQQSYVWRADGAEIRVHFSDDRPFHRFDLQSAHPLARYWCDPDRYDVEYDFSVWPDWTASWKARGPRKDYSMTTRYARTETRAANPGA